MASDRRILYTKQFIKEAFLALLEEHSIDDITVKALCEEADINRATFYRHYTDIYNLFEQLEKEMCAETSATVVKDIIDVRVLTNVYQNQGFYKAFLHANLLMSLIKERNQYHYEAQLAEAKEQEGFDAKKFKYSFDFFVYGVQGLVKDWVEQGCQETPEEFAEILSDITRHL